MNYSSLKADIAAVVRENGNQEITGENLQGVLTEMIDNSVGTGYLYKGIATPETQGGTPDQNVFYLAGAGTYGNFGGTIIPQGSFGVFKYNGEWTFNVIEVAAGAVLYTPQTLTDEQKEQAQGNIGLDDVLRENINPKGDNLITNDVTWTDGKYAQTKTNSGYGTNSNLSVSNKIPVEAGQVYEFLSYTTTLTGAFVCRVTGTDGQYKVYQSTEPYFDDISIDGKTVTMKIPNDGAFIEINILTADKPSAFLRRIYSEGDHRPIDWLEVNRDNLSQELDDAIYDIQAVQIDGSQQIISIGEDVALDEFTEGGYKTGYDGLPIASSTTIHSAIIDVTEGETYIIHNNQAIAPDSTSAVSYYVFGIDSSTPAIPKEEIKDYVSLVEGTTDVYLVKIPSKCNIFYYTIRDSNVPVSYVKHVQTQKSLAWLELLTANITDEIVDYIVGKAGTLHDYHLWDSIRKPIVFSGKKMIAFGDSITAGTSSPGLVPAGSDSYINLFMEHAGVASTSSVKAVGGSCLTDTASYDEQYNICKRVKQYADSTTDIIWIAGGTNDWNTGRPIGDYTSTDTATLYGALRDVCEWLKTNCPDAVVIFVTPIPYTKPASMYPNHIAPLDAYRSAIYDIATLYGYNVVDGSSLGMPRALGNWNNAMCADSDGCHPTLAGHALMYRNLCGKLL